MAAGRARIRPEDRVFLDHVELSDADFSGRKLVQLAVAGSRLVGCRFENVRVRGASMGAGRKMSHYVECSFDGARMTMGPGGYARFERCSFQDVDLRDWFCFAVEMIDCRFTGRLRKGIFNGSVPEDQRQVTGRSRNEFHGNDFSGMELIGVTFRTGIDLSRQLLPVGSEYLYMVDAAVGVQRARAAVTAWHDLAARREALTLIDILAAEVSGGQRQMLLRRDDYPLPAKILDSVLALLVS